MPTEAVCGWCGGTGKVEVYEHWEQALLQIDRAWALVGSGVADHVVSLNVDGSYPAAVEVLAGQDDLEAIERLLTFWPMIGDGQFVNPLNGDRGVFEPVNPRFWDAS